MKKEEVFTAADKKICRWQIFCCEIIKFCMSNMHV